MKAIFWDLDDTVLNTLPGRMEALRHSYEQCVGGTIDPLEVWKSHRGGSLEALGRRLLGDGWQRFAETYRDHYYNRSSPPPVPFEGVREILDQSLESGLKLAVVTSKISWGAIDELERAGLLGYFGTVVGHDDVEKPKPDPDPIFEAMARLVIDDAAQILFVGDSPADVWAARNAGCPSVAATWGTIDTEALLDAAPTYVARTPRGVLQALESILAERNG
ncbi:MAG: HAD family hydrolase [Dehalococcoidia bacterium]